MVPTFANGTKPLPMLVAVDMLETHGALDVIPAQSEESPELPPVSHHPISMSRCPACRLLKDLPSALTRSRVPVQVHPLLCRSTAVEACHRAGQQGWARGRSTESLNGLIMVTAQFGRIVRQDRSADGIELRNFPLPARERKLFCPCVNSVGENDDSRDSP